MAKPSYSRYAEALFALAKEDKAEVAYQKALRDIQKEFLSNPELTSFLSSFAIPKEELFKAVDEAFASYGLKHLCPFMKLLVEKRVIPHFEEIVVAYSSLANDASGVKEGIAYSASPLSEAEISSLEKSLSKRLLSRVELTSRVEPSLLGGVRVYIDDKVFDGSLTTKIDNLRARLLGGEK